MRPYRNVLVVQPYGIGDLLFLTPVLRALRLLPGIEKVDLLLGSRTESVVRHNPHVDRIFEVNKDLFHQRNFSANLQEMWKLARILKSNRYDLLLDYSFRDEYAFLAKFFLRVPVRSGYSRKRRGLFLNRKVGIAKGFAASHVTDYAARVAEMANVPVDDRWMEFYLSEEERKQAIERMKAQPELEEGRFLTVSLGGGESWGRDANFKRWPVERFVELTEKLMNDLDLDACLLVGSPGEIPLAEQFCQMSKQKTVNLTGQLSLEMTASLIEKSCAFVGNDGGLVHLTHALKIPLLAFYGPVDPQVYGPYPADPSALALFKKDLECRPCYQNFRYRQDCVGRECLQALDVQEVYETIMTKGWLNLAKNKRFVG